MTEEEKEMTIWDHLGELRNRLFIALISLVVTTLISFIFADRFIQVLAIPMPGGLQSLLAIEVTENISVFMKVSLLSGFILALPFVLYELLAFVMPGLTDTERRWVMISIPLASVFFLIGVAFCYFVMLPAAIPFLTGFLGVKTTPRLSSYIGFVTNMMFWIGISFELPLLVFILAKLKIVHARMLLKQWRVAIVVIAVVAAVVTPTPDPVNMSLLMAPLFVLYMLSILFAYLARRGEESVDDKDKLAEQ
jgi:sec-independent protein translocase protein TatC